MQPYTYLCRTPSICDEKDREGIQIVWQELHHNCDDDGGEEAAKENRRISKNSGSLSTELRYVICMIEMCMQEMATAARNWGLGPEKHWMCW